jgi:hypothetical protein
MTLLFKIVVSWTDPSRASGVARPRNRHAHRGLESRILNRMEADESLSADRKAGGHSATPELL